MYRKSIRILFSSLAFTLIFSSCSFAESYYSPCHEGTEILHARTERDDDDIIRSIAVWSEVWRGHTSRLRSHLYGERTARRYTPINEGPISLDTWFLAEGSVATVSPATYFAPKYTSGPSLSNNETNLPGKLFLCVSHLYRGDGTDEHEIFALQLSEAESHGLNLELTPRIGDLDVEYVTPTSPGLERK